MSRLFVVAGPSGAGKTSLLKSVLPTLNNTWLSVSLTTRPPRHGEVSGKDYYFVSAEEFKRRRLQNEFLESAEVYGYSYATSRQAIETALAQGKTVILEIDCQGAEQVRRQIDCTSVMIAPPSIDDLRARLEQRGKDSAEIIRRRVSQAQAELEQKEQFDFIVVNQDFDTAAARLKDILAGNHREKP